MTFYFWRSTPQNQGRFKRPKQGPHLGFRVDNRYVDWFPCYPTRGFSSPTSWPQIMEMQATQKMCTPLKIKGWNIIPWSGLFQIIFLPQWVMAVGEPAVNLPGCKRHYFFGKMGGWQFFVVPIYLSYPLNFRPFFGGWFLYNRITPLNPLNSGAHLGFRKPKITTQRKRRKPAQAWSGLFFPWKFSGQWLREGLDTNLQHFKLWKNTNFFVDESGC